MRVNAGYCYIRKISYLAGFELMRGAKLPRFATDRTKNGVRSPHYFYKIVAPLMTHI